MPSFYQFERGITIVWRIRKIWRSVDYKDTQILVRYWPKIGFNRGS